MTFPTDYENIVIDLSHPAIERLLTVLDDVTSPALDGFVERELQNLVNVLNNSLEPGRARPVVREETWLDA